MKKIVKLSKKYDDKLFSICSIGSLEEGVSKIFNELKSHKDNYTLYIPFTLPKEIVIARLNTFTKNIARADLLKIVKKSPDRIEPKCKHFFKCGGCILQHWNFNIYKNWKLKKITYQILKISKNTEIKSIIFSSLKSRKSVKFNVKKNKSKILIGFNEFRNNNIINIDSCIIFKDELIKFVHEIKEPRNQFLLRSEKINIYAILLDHVIDVLIDGLKNILHPKFIKFREAL